MAIKKRTARPTAEQEQADTSGPLVIVAKPKKPVPTGGKVQDVYGDSPTPSHMRSLGNLALAVHRETADADLTVEDRFRLMRTSFDQNNPQEQRYRNRVRNRGTAITAFCITCQGGRKAVTECIDTTCPLWAFRFGSDPFYGNRS